MSPKNETKKCKHCDRPIKKTNQTFCDRECYREYHNANSWVSSACPTCGKLLKKPKSLVLMYKNMYCDKKCEMEHRSKIASKNRKMGIRSGGLVTSGAEGEKYNKLTAIKWLGIENHKSVWEFKCDCGNSTTAKLSLVKYGHIKSCGCAKYGRESANKLPYGEASFRSLYASRKTDAKKRNIIFELNIEEFRQLAEGICQYCGIPPSQTMLGTYHGGVNGGYVYNGIDRIDSTKGYTRDNVVSCCGRCNLAKRKMTVNEFLDWVAQVYKYSCMRRKQNEKTDRMQYRETQRSIKKTE